MGSTRSQLRHFARKALRSLPPLLSVYNLARAERNARRLLASAQQVRPTLVYQMGKVGSSTVLRTLEAIPEIPKPVAHVHFLEPSYIAEVRAQAIRDAGRMRVGYTWALGRAIATRFVRLGDALDVDAITLVRDPIARAVSAVFQSPHLAHVSEASLLGRDGRLDVKQTLAWVAESIASLGSGDYPERWLQREIEPVLGVDVFAHPFDFDRGYRLIEGPRGRVLVLRTEDLDRRLGAALQEFYGLGDSPPIVRANVRRDQGRREDYDQVLEQLRLPLALVRGIYEARYARHFYSPEEIGRMQERWCGDSGRVRRRC